MKKILILLIFTLLLSACGTSTYDIVDEDTVDGYLIYKKEEKGLFCNTYWEDVYYSSETYNFGFSFYGCSASMTFFIMNNDMEYVYIRDALDQGLITLDSLIPHLSQLERNPEEISSDEADYYWLDFHIDGRVVYAYAGGVCDQNGSETFVINGTTYIYSANGCLKDNILFMRIDGENIPIITLLNNGTVDGEYLIPLLIEQTN
jgi:hypothetical protein